MPPCYETSHDSVLTKRIIKIKKYAITIFNGNGKHSFCNLRLLYKVIDKIINNRMEPGIYNVCDTNPKVIKNIIKLNNYKIMFNINPKILISVFTLLQSLDSFSMFRRFRQILHKLAVSNLYCNKKLRQYYCNSKKK